jgi:hypothetical protein
MITRFRLGILVGLIGLSLATLQAQQRGAQPAGTQKPEAPEVFCNTMQAGALCPTATVSILIDRWMDKGINPEVNRILASRTATR